MAAGGGRGALSRLVARLSWALLKRERMGVDELGNAYYRWGGAAALRGASGPVNSVPRCFIPHSNRSPLHDCVAPCLSGRFLPQPQEAGEERVWG